MMGEKEIKGTGRCICPQPPESVQATADKWQCTFAAAGINVILDHRCPHHGEKAQPAVWGRHKELTLAVTPAEWQSLGVTRQEA